MIDRKEKSYEISDCCISVCCKVRFRNVLIIKAFKIVGFNRIFSRENFYEKDTF